MSDAPPVTPQQRKLSEGGLSSYKSLVCGDSSWIQFVLFEAVQLFTFGLPGVLGLGLRSLLIRHFLKACGTRPAIGSNVTFRGTSEISFGNKVFIEDFATIDAREKSSIALGDFVSVGRHSIVAAKGGIVELRSGSNIGSFCRIATQSKVTIGESTLIAGYCYIGPGNHKRNSADGTFISGEMDIKGGVSIGSNVWVGTRTTILDGVSIGDGAIVGAHSLVTEDVAPGAVVAGVPAKPLK
ncbi:MAG: hypothetical protein KDD64_05435 [Bdellovibrionales bacterium]|nr:hypothetical protein [Bdellovibrionales bacterium]